MDPLFDFLFPAGYLINDGVDDSFDVILLRVLTIAAGLQPALRDTLLIWVQVFFEIGIMPSFINVGEFVNHYF